MNSPDGRTRTAREVGEESLLTGQIVVRLKMPSRRPAASKSSRKAKIRSIPVKVSSHFFCPHVRRVDVTSVITSGNAQFLRVWPRQCVDPLGLTRRKETSIQERCRPNRESNGVSSRASLGGVKPGTPCDSRRQHTYRLINMAIAQTRDCSPTACLQCHTTRDVPAACGSGPTFCPSPVFHGRTAAAAHDSHPA